MTKNAFNAPNLHIHDEENSSRMDVLGVRLYGDGHTAKPTTKRRERLRAAINFIPSQRAVCGEVLQVCMVHLCLFILSTESSTFITIPGSQILTLWHSVRRELECAFGLVYLRQSSWDQSDVCEHGSGITSRTETAGEAREAREVGSVRERLKFKRREGGSLNAAPRLGAVVDNVMTPTDPKLVEALDDLAQRGCRYHAILF